MSPVTAGCLRGLMVKALPSHLSANALGRSQHPGGDAGSTPVAGIQLRVWCRSCRVAFMAHVRARMGARTHNTHTHTRTHTHAHTKTQRCAQRNTRPQQERQRRTQHGHNPPSLFQPKTATLKDIAIAPMTTTLARCLAELLR